MSTRLPAWVRQHLAALRALGVFTVAVGLIYPLVVTGVALLPGLSTRAQGSLLTDPDGRTIGFVRNRGQQPPRREFGGGALGDIYVMNADGSGQRNLTRGLRQQAFGIAWSPGQR